MEERGPLLGIVPGEELLGHEGIPLEPAEADEKGHRAGTSGEPGRLRVEEEGLAVIESLQVRVIRQDGDPPHVEGGEVPDAEPAVS